MKWKWYHMLWFCAIFYFGGHTIAKQQAKQIDKPLCSAPSELVIYHGAAADVYLVKEASIKGCVIEYTDLAGRPGTLRCPAGWPDAVNPIDGVEPNQTANESRNDAKRENGEHKSF